MTYFDRIIDADSTYWKEAKPLHVAPKYKRFINFFVDYFIGGSICGIAAGISLGLGLTYFNQQELLHVYIASPFYKFLMTLFVVIVYYTLSEYYLDGKTLGKYITRTRVVSQSGEPLSFGQILKRSCARFLPFETISVLLGHKGKGGWHDQISKTIVVEEWVEREEVKEEVGNIQLQTVQS